MEAREIFVLTSPEATIRFTAVCRRLLCSWLFAACIVQGADAPRLTAVHVTPNVSGAASGGSQIEPGRVTITNTSVNDLLRILYDVPEFGIENAPAWFESERYDIVAEVSGDPERDELRRLMRSVLHDEFRLVLHEEPRELAVFELSIDGALGPGMNPGSADCDRDPAACPHELAGGSFSARAMAIERIIRTLAELSGRPIIDRSDLAGRYDVDLTWAGDSEALRAAVREQLGLRLEPAVERATVLVIDSALQPLR